MGEKIITSLSKKKEKGKKKKGKKGKGKGEEKGGKEEIGKKKEKGGFGSHRKISKTFVGGKTYFSPRRKEYHIFSRCECI